MSLAKWTIWALLAVVVATGAVMTFAQLRERQKAKVTAERIRVLSTMLLAERPALVSAGTLAAVCEKYRRSDTLIDAWGRPLAVHMDGRHYVVTSFGRDGLPSGCCIPAEQATADTDLIAVDGQWKQIWN